MTWRLANRGGAVPGSRRCPPRLVAPAVGLEPGAAMQGFTLVELLIALSLMALILLLLFSGLRLGSRAWEGVEQVVTRHAEERIARRLLLGSLNQARPVEAVFEDARRPVFAGDDQRLELVAPLAEQVGIGGLYLLRFSLEDVAGRPALVMTRWLLHPDVLVGTAEIPPWVPLAEAGPIALDMGTIGQDSAAGAYGSRQLLTAITGFEIAYYGVLPGDDEADWVTEWIDQAELPERVRIHLATDSGVWPELIATLPSGG